MVISMDDLIEGHSYVVDVEGEEVEGRLVGEIWIGRRLMEPSGRFVFVNPADRHFTAKRDQVLREV